MAKSDDRKEKVLVQTPKYAGVIRFSRNWFNGVPYISIREWTYSDVSGDLVPTKKGINVKESDFLLASDIAQADTETSAQETKQDLQDAIASIKGVDLTATG